MGDKNSKKVNVKNKKIIHYNQNNNSDFMDVFLCAKAKFFIGNSSGLKAISQCFDVPIAASNQIGFNVLLQPTNSLLIYKKLFSMQKQRLLTYNEILKLNLFDKSKGNQGYFSAFYEKNNLVPIENTSEEIHNLVIDMFDIINEKKSTFYKNLQKQFKIIFFKDYTDINLSGNISPRFLCLNKNLFKL